MIDWLRSRLRRGHDKLLERAESAYARGALDEARQACLQLVRASGDHPRALVLLASVAAEKKLIDEGLQWARRALQADPREAAPHYALGRVLEAAGRYADAEASYRTATQLEPRNPKMHNNLGVALHMQGRLDEALACYRRALDLDPAQPQANQNYAAILRDPDAQKRAIEGYLRYTAENPRDVAALRSLGNLYAETGRLDEALDAYARALAIEPTDAATHFTKAMLHLTRGEYAEGWKEYEWRWQLDGLNATMKRFRERLWNGERLVGATILLHGETGFGDMLQFARYVPLVAERCGAVVVECQPALKSLLCDLAGAGRVVGQGEALPPFDAHIPLVRLPYVFGTTLESIPWSGAYVHAPHERRARWQAMLGTRGPNRRIGLAWTGNPMNLGNLKRSLRLADLAPLARLPNVEFYSLQKGAGAEEVAAAPAGFRVIDLTAQIADFADSAALVTELDLIISVDTSVAHLAGAMGAPVWVPLSFSPDWRYHLARSDNPWYPTMRLFRQPQDGDWARVVEAMHIALEDVTSRAWTSNAPSP